MPGRNEPRQIDRRALAQRVALLREPADPLPRPGWLAAAALLVPPLGAAGTELLPALPDETRVLSGHGPETTIGEERAHNAFLGGDLL